MNGTILILREARSRVDRGWAQNKAYDSWGNVCAGHAIDLAFSSVYADEGVEVTHEDREQAVAVLLQTAVRRAGRFYPSIPDWNDAETTTKVMVLAAFDEAITLLSQPEPPEKINIRYKIPDRTALSSYVLPPDLEAVIAEANAKVIPIKIEGPVEEPEEAKGIVKKALAVLGV